MDRTIFEQDFKRLRDAYNTPIQDQEEFWDLIVAVENNNTHKVLEIGVEKGGTLWFWDKIVGATGKVVGADLRNNVVFSLGECVSDITTIEGNSHSEEIISEIKKHFPDNDVDFLFIDGDHTYEGVKEDFDNFSPLVKPGGIIAFHDIKGDGVQYFWPEVRSGFAQTAEYHRSIGIGIIFLEGNK